MKTIKLSMGCLAKVDNRDFDKLSKNKWHVSISHNLNPVAYTYIKAVGKNKHVAMARLIMNAADGEYVDHKNGDTLDNRRCNLRICTMSENNRNRGMMKSNTTGYKGVQWITLKQKWVARIKFQKRLFQVGSFCNKKDAAIAYNKAAKEYFGEFARLNIIK